MGNEPIGPFKGEYRWLSNFWEAPIHLNGMTYPTTEHFYQSSKTLDVQEKDAILTSQKPREAKFLGADATIRDDWDDLKLGIMLQANLLKYTQHDSLGNLLMDTGDETLVEFNRWHDNFWGVCTCDTCDSKLGENNLGLTLMLIRASLRNMKSTSANNFN